MAFYALYYVHLRGELWLKHVRDFMRTNNLLFYMNCVYLVVCMGDNSIISVAYLRTKSQIPSADGSLVIPPPKKKIWKKGKLKKLYIGHPPCCHFISHQKVWVFYNLHVYSLVRHIVKSDCRCKKQKVEYYTGQGVYQATWRQTAESKSSSEWPP